MCRGAGRPGRQVAHQWWLPAGPRGGAACVAWQLYANDGAGD
jgi:hypothetical protein